MSPVQCYAIGELVWKGLRYGNLLIFIDLLVLLLYVMAPFINLLVFFIMNSSILGRENYELVALRRLRDIEMRILWNRRKKVLWMASGVINGLLAIPGVNLLAPLLLPLLPLPSWSTCSRGWRRCGTESLLPAQKRDNRTV